MTCWIVRLPYSMNMTPSLESELADLRESVRRGTEQADAGQVVPAGEVFEELRERNASLTKQGR